MSQLICIWFPNWPVQRLQHERSELRAKPIVIHSPQAQRGSFVAGCSAEAARLGVVPGMPLAEAEALGNNAHFEPANAAVDRDLLREAARTCESFTPVFGIEAADVPECLLLDVDGCSHLFGGDQPLVNAVARDFRERGFQTRTAAAPTIGAAWAAARELARNDHQPVLQEAQLPSVLSPLSVESLRLSPKIVGTLRELGLNRIGQLRELPRSSLPSRFGAELLKRLDQAFGDEPESFLPERPVEPIAATWATEEPFSDRESLRAVCRELLAQLLNRLQPRRDGVRQLLCQIKDSSGRPTELTVHLVAASDSERHLLELLNLQLDRVSLPESVAFVRLEATSIAPLAARQRDLFGFETDTDTFREVSSLVNRLSSRLGVNSVVHARLLPEAQPELAVAQQPVALQTGRGQALRNSELAESSVNSREPIDCQFRIPKCLTPLLASRPLRLFTPPQPIAVSDAGPEGAPLSFHWDRREHRVIRSWGPERIETGWWRDDIAHRDYFRVETQTGQRFWLFHCLDRLTWFLHGSFE